MHDPEQHVARATALAKGGAQASKLRAIKGRRSKLATASELVTFTAGVIHDVLEGKLETDTARVVLYGVSIQRQLVEIADLERRLTVLEERFGGQPSRGRSWRGWDNHRSPTNRGDGALTASHQTVGDFQVKVQH